MGGNGDGGWGMGDERMGLFVVSSISEPRFRASLSRNGRVVAELILRFHWDNPLVILALGICSVVCRAWSAKGGRCVILFAVGMGNF